MNIKSLMSKAKSSTLSVTSSANNFLKSKTKGGQSNTEFNVNPAFKNSSKGFAILRKLKIKTRLLFSFIFLLIVMLLITGIFSYSSSTKTIDDKVKSYSLQVMDQTSVVLNNEVTRMEYYFMDVGVNSTMQEALNGKEVDNYTVSNFLNNKFVTTNDVYYCGIQYGPDFSSVSSFNSQGMTLDTAAIAAKDLQQPEWSDIEIKTGGSDTKTKYFGVQRNINYTLNGKIIGKMVIIPKPNFLSTSFADLDIGEDKATKTEFPIFVTDTNGKIISSRNAEQYPLGDGNDVTKQVGGNLGKILKAKMEIKSGNLELNIEGKPSLVTYSRVNKNKDWFVVSIVPYSYLNSEANALRTQILIIGVICVLIAFLLCLLIARSVSLPLDRLVLSMKKAKEGDLTSKIVDNQRDEIADVCRNYNDMLYNINSLVSQVRLSSQSVLGASNKIAAASEATLNASEQVSVTVEQIARGATDQANEINESVNNMDKLSEGITLVKDDVAQVIAIANKINSLNANASKTINALNVKSGQVSETTNKVSTNINDLSKSMNEIQKILKIMIGISEQTNLLSLNAAIEAARAGEAGKGFAVVANEVKKLAEQSKEFTGSINSIITSIGQKTNNIVQEVSNSNVVVEEQISAVKDTEELFTTVFSAMGEVLTDIARTEKSVENIMKSKEKVLESMENISAVAEESAATTEEISASTEEQIASAEELSNHARELNDLSETLNRELNKFKTE